MAWLGGKLLALAGDRVFVSPQDSVLSAKAPIRPRSALAFRYPQSFLLVDLPEFIKGQSTRATVYGISGQKVLEVDGKKSKEVMAIPTDGISNGRYVLEIRYANRRISQPFLYAR